MDKAELVRVLEEIATYLELKGENPFKVRAYRNAAKAVEGLAEDVTKLVAEGRLAQVPGIGEGIASKIAELVTTGHLPYYEELKREFPETLLHILELPGVGPKRAKALYEQLGIADIDSLEKACREKRVRGLPGFGEKTEATILQAIEEHRRFQAYHRYGELIELAEKLVEALRSCPEVIRVSLAGSFRRGKEVVHDLDVLASSRSPRKVMDFFVQLPGVSRVLSHGETKSSVLLEGGLACDLRVVPDRDYPYALHHLTGSKEHNIAMRQRAIAQGKKLSEWGLFRTTGPALSPAAASEETEDNPHRPEHASTHDLIVCRDEADIFEALGLSYIPPELRENMGEIEMAEKGMIPKLVEWTELRGTFHCHTTASDGRNSLVEMAQAAQELGLEYLGIADHSKSSFQANGLTEERLAQQMEEIRRWNAQNREPYLFAGTECDILKDGRLDFSDEVLASLDYVVASIHTGFSSSEKENTRRLLRAMENPYVTILGHPTGRLLLARNPYPVNLEEVIEKAAATGTWIELNAHPWRLDLDWRWWRKAKEKGVLCVINPDAHRCSDLAFLRLGVKMARKGWLTTHDVVNTLPLAKMHRALKTKRLKHQA
ncbi:helix-hairpin-helix domain-containing protein [Candidatus Methylacidithermus pantelleriae]|uniref:DNA polymerase beta n=1 Tax=Candidatus Methylacidithermus pantelleriae TaxID=2744239 RepID=A0A8J2BK41_9BACT|nr:helix-hairpin-helix domain-containing protein [Candidatus Methylacidithermus pantelleriae]CAF0698966.1 DNA polymerase beta [Candidatus Methylacidithermus pantelleriae]